MSNDGKQEKVCSYALRRMAPMRSGGKRVADVRRAVRIYACLIEVNAERWRPRRSPGNPAFDSTYVITRFSPRTAVMGLALYTRKSLKGLQRFGATGCIDRQSARFEQSWNVTEGVGADCSMIEVLGYRRPSSFVERSSLPPGRC